MKYKAKNYNYVKSPILVGQTQRGDYVEGRTCPDCGARRFERHESGCDQEVCPFCGGQAAFCDCELEEVEE
jgi:hypothetical protein